MKPSYVATPAFCYDPNKTKITAAHLASSPGLIFCVRNEQTVQTDSRAKNKSLKNHLSDRYINVSRKFGQGTRLLPTTHHSSAHHTPSMTCCHKTQCKLIIHISTCIATYYPQKFINNPAHTIFAISQCAPPPPQLYVQICIQIDLTFGKCYD